MDLITQLSQLESAQLVRRIGDEEDAYIFKHALTQDTAYQSLLLKRRREIHRLVAHAYEAQYGDRCLDDYAGILAQHYAEAGDDARVLVYSTRAGDLAARVYANAEALEHYSRALDAARRTGATTAQLIHLYTRRGRVLEVIGQYDKALSSYEEMASLAQTRNNRELELASLLPRATLRSAPMVTFNAELGQEHLDQALVLARELGDRAAEAKILWNSLLLSLHASQPKQAIEYGERALAIARELNSSGRDMRDQLAYILHDLSTPYLFGADPARGVALSAEARELWRALDNKPMLADSLGMVAQLSVFQGNFVSALEYGSEGAAIAQSSGNGFGVIFNKSFIAVSHLELGEFDAVWRLGNELLQHAETIGAMNVAIPASIFAWFLAMLGVFEPAREMDRRARLTLTGPMPSHFRVRSYATLARANILRGELAAAAGDIAACRLETLPDMQFYAVAQMGLAEGELALAQNDPARACGVVDPYISTGQQSGFRWMLPDLLLVRGISLRQEGEMDAALESLDQARTLATEMNARRMLWQILALLSQVEKERGNGTEAVKLKTQAREIVEYIVAHTPQQFRESILNLPDVRAVST